MPTNAEMEKNLAAQRAKAMETQKEEFEAVGQLCARYRALPPVVDDDYPEARHFYEGAVKDVIEAFKANGRL